VTKLNKKIPLTFTVHTETNKRCRWPQEFD